MSFLSSRKVLGILILAVILIAVPITLFLLSQEQDIRQEASGQADLIVSSLQLTDAGGNVRSIFGVGEEIYVRVRFKNIGFATGTSSDGFTYTQIYKNKSDAVAPNTQSDAGISMKNGQFTAGQEKTYESYLSSDTTSFFRHGTAKSWHVSQSGDYTARAYINFNGNVQESNIQNNQATLSYRVTDKFIEDDIYLDGTVTTSAPSGFTSKPCVPPSPPRVSGLTGCIVKGPVNGRTLAKITNTSSTTKKVGGAVTRSYFDYPNPYPSCTTAECPDLFIWIWTQTIYSAKTFDLGSGQTRYISLPIPDCNWQMDIFQGDILLSYLPPSQTYSGQGRYIDGWLEQNSTQVCRPKQPEPTPTPTPPITPTPTPTVCPPPQAVPNVRINCPYCAE